METNTNKTEKSLLHINSKYWDGEFQKAVEFFIRDSLIMGTPFSVDAEIPEELKLELVVMAQNEANNLSKKNKLFWFNIHNDDEFIEFTPRRIEL